VEKKFKFSDNPTAAKVIYGSVIALLCITAIIIGIVAANSRKNDEVPDPNPPITDGDGNTDGDNTPNDDENTGDKDSAIFLAPVSGTVVKSHSTDTPVFSETLEEWRVHLGVDISTAEDAGVYAVADGEVSAVYSDPLLGYTVEVTHGNGIKSRYSNLAAEGLPAVSDAVKAGDKIATVGYSAITEIADETHLHFEMFVDGAAVNPLDYISEEAKKVSLGIESEEES
jgi:murein DD-endopeptidase MepM/ murein hydrolase activator NlpD